MIIKGNRKENKLCGSSFLLQRGQMNSRGFTLIEFTLIIVMMGILAISISNVLGNVGAVSLDAASWKVQADIRYAKQLAMSTNRNHGVNFTVDNGYEVYDTNVGSAVVSPQTRNDLREDFAEFDGVDIGSDFQVEFNQIGSPIIGGGGEVELVSEHGSSKTISIIANTGAVVVEDS